MYPSVSIVVIVNTLVGSDPQYGAGTARESEHGVMAQLTSAACKPLYSPGLHLHAGMKAGYAEHASTFCAEP